MTSTGGWKNDMLVLADYAFLRLRTRLEGLSADEYLWEPVEDSWTVRRGEDGIVRGDWQSPVWPAPFTTIAWRIGHLINNLFDPRYATHLAQAPIAPPPASLPATAQEAIRVLDDGFRSMRTYLAATTDDSLTEILGPVAGPWAEDDRGSFVLHMLDELIHHSAEVALLRDLYRSHRPTAAIVAALLDGDRGEVQRIESEDPGALDRAKSLRADLLLQATAEAKWGSVPLLLELGFLPAMPNGSSALHHASAGGHLPTVELLLAAGVDPTLREDHYRATPLEWAEFFGQDEIAARLSDLGEG